MDFMMKSQDMNYVDELFVNKVVAWYESNIKSHRRSIEYYYAAKHKIQLISEENNTPLPSQRSL